MIPMANADTQSLLEWLLDLLKDPAARADLLDDPNRYLDIHGFGDVDSRDLYDALCLAADNDRGHSDHNDHGNHYPPPKHYNNHEDAGHYLKSYITNNYTYVDDRDTNVDNSIHQKIDTDGGDFDQNIDNHSVTASGDGAIAAGGDIRDSTLTTGDGNVVGDNNEAVTGNHNTTAFGQGDATNASFDDAHFGSGSGVSLGGDATGSAQDNDTSTSVHGGDGATTVNAAGDHGDANAVANQAHTESDFDSHVDDHSSVDNHADLNSHNSADFDDSHNTNIHT
jgi:hypothetical protein